MSGSVLFLNALLSAISDGAYALTAGLLLADLWLADPGWADQKSAQCRNEVRRSLRRLLLLGIGVLVLCDLLRPLVLAASMTGSTQPGDMLPAVPQVLLETHQGTVWFILTAATALLAACAIWRGERQPRLRQAALLLFLIALSLCKAASGHAADNGDFTWSEILQALHILATAVWAGGVAVSAFVVIPRLAISEPAEAIAEYATRLSNAATVAVVVILGSGIYTGLRESNNSIPALWTSAWGQVLTAKITVVLAALGMGAFNRFVGLRLPVSASKMQTMARVLAAEAVALAVVIALSGLLGSLSPPEST